MKLIAKTPNSYLAEVTDDEIANLLGFNSKYDDGFRTVARNRRDEDLTGLDIEIERMADTFRSLRGLNKTNISTARTALSHAQDTIDELQDIVNKMTLFETLKEA